MNWYIHLLTTCQSTAVSRANIQEKITNASSQNKRLKLLMRAYSRIHKKMKDTATPAQMVAYVKSDFCTFITNVVSRLVSDSLRTFLLELLRAWSLVAVLWTETWRLFVTDWGWLGCWMSTSSREQNTLQSPCLAEKNSEKILVQECSRNWSTDVRFGRPVGVINRQWRTVSAFCILRVRYLWE